MPDMSATPRQIGFLVFPDFQILDLTGPVAVFEVANGLAGMTAYTLRTISKPGGLVTSTAGLAVMTEPAVEFGYDTVLVSGGEGAPAVSEAKDYRGMVQALAARARRMASVCTGAFLLAGAGLLDGRTATTHWRFATKLQREHPAVRVVSEPIFVRDGQVWTAAGVTAGIDLAIALVEEDLGLELSKAVARELVMYHRRPGGQSQFSAMLDLEPSSDRIRCALAYAREHLPEPLSVGILAGIARLSERQFGRAFRAETGETPARAIERLRAEAARMRIESGREPVEAVAAAIGFADPERMRRAFLRVYGQPPQSLRRAARTGKPIKGVSQDKRSVPHSKGVCVRRVPRLDRSDCFSSDPKDQVG